MSLFPGTREEEAEAGAGAICEGVVKEGPGWRRRAVALGEGCVRRPRTWSTDGWQPAPVAAEDAGDEEELQIWATAFGISERTGATIPCR